MKKRSLFLSGLLATSLLVGGVLVGCGTTDAGDTTDTTDSTDTDDITNNTDTADTTDNTDNTDSTDSTDNADTTDTTDSTDTPDTTTATTYKIAFSETNEVVATLSAAEATAGTKIDITIVSVPDDYVITSITSDVADLVITVESETLYTFNMPESDVNLTINIEFVLGTNYETGDTYIINTGDYPNNLQVSDIYFELDGNPSHSLGTINSSVYYYNRGMPSIELAFGIINTNIDIDNYSFSVSGYCYDKNAQQINISFGEPSNSRDGKSGFFWSFSGHNFLDGNEIYAAFITINWTSNA